MPPAADASGTATAKPPWKRSFAASLQSGCQRTSPVRDLRPSMADAEYNLVAGAAPRWCHGAGMSGWAWGFGEDRWLGPRHGDHHGMGISMNRKLALPPGA